MLPYVYTCIYTPVYVVSIYIYMYISDYVVACAPGNFGGPPVVTLTDLGNGQFGREEMPQCLECPIGTFQDEKASETCKSCPGLHSTLAMAAEKDTYCISE